MIERAGGSVAMEPVMPPLLLIDPAGGKLIGRGEVAEDHCPVGNARPDDTVLPGEHVDQPFERRRRKDHPVTDLSDERGHSVFSPT